MRLPNPSGTRPRRLRWPSLYLQVLIAILAGVLLGGFGPSTAVTMRPLGDGFLLLIKLLIAPIIFTTITSGIVGMGDLKKVGRVGGKALLWFELMTTVALVFGLAMAHLIHPGVGVHASLTALKESSTELPKAAAHVKSLSDQVLAIIPESLRRLFGGGAALQVLVVSLLVGVGLAMLGKRGAPLVRGIERVSTALFAIIGAVMHLAPIGAFGAMSYTVGRYGLASLGGLLKLVATFYAASLLFVLLALGLVLRLLGLSIFRLLVYLREELALVVGTSSSETALPRLIDKLEALGASPRVVRLVVPTGYSFNLDGTSIYLTLGALFVAQALDLPLSVRAEAQLLLVLLLTSKGAAGVTGSGLVTLGATLSATGTLPVAGLTLLLGIDRFMSEARALTNLVGNAVATLVVARWEGELELSQARARLAPPVGTAATNSTEAAPG
jgi:aerobic C4-dicarboxylate transport protein